ncbi:hypothetical protein M2169_005191 [Streptomyces sp. MJP52]|nr:hypothetical protein [Streptomyces sp. MJP52]
MRRPASRTGWWSSRPTARHRPSGRGTRSTPGNGCPAPAPPRAPARLLFAPDLVGPSEELAERLTSLASFREVDEVAFALPFTFAKEDHEQILTDFATRLGPLLGWRPAG